MPVVVVLTTGTSWTVPANCPNTLLLVECWSPGQNGSGNPAGGGGGGGAYSASSNVDITGHLTTIPIKIGFPGNTAGQRFTSFNNGVVLAAGTTNSLSSTGTPGGDAASGVGDVRYSGGKGGDGSGSTAGGGGGGAGPHGNGLPGADAVSGFPAAGGAGDAGFGGAGSTASGVSGAANVNGGGGGCGGNGSTLGTIGGTPGGATGGGGSPANTTSGQIRITYEPIPTALLRTDTLLPKLLELTPTLAASSQLVDALAPRLDEVTATTAQFTATDVLTPMLDDLVVLLFIAAAVTAADTLTPKTDEAVQSLISTLALVDELRVQTDTVAALTVVLDRLDELLVAPVDELVLISFLARVEQLAPMLLDTANVIAARTASDILLLQVAEAESAGPELKPEPGFEWRRINGRWAMLPAEAQLVPDLGAGKGTPIEILDDGVWSGRLPGDVGIFAAVCENPVYSAEVAYSRLGLGEGVTKLLGSNSVEVSTDILTGTRGTDGKVTYAFDRLRGFMIENRSGTTLRFYLNVLTRGVETN